MYCFDKCIMMSCQDCSVYVNKMSNYIFVIGSFVDGPTVFCLRVVVIYHPSFFRKFTITLVRVKILTSNIVSVILIVVNVTNF